MTSSHFTGGTIFCDAASGFVHVAHQIGRTANETVQATIEFERSASKVGVMVQAYHLDNGTYKSHEFLKEIMSKGQGIKMSSVSAHHQNGAAKNAIKIVVTKAQTMILHAALCWPNMTKKTLWPLALSHAAYLYNCTPSQQTGITPIEVWSQAKSDHHALRSLHPWGCPIYILDPKL